LPPARRWTVERPGRLHWRVWDGEYVVFDSHSGDTHLLNQVAAVALQLLGETPASADELARRVAQRLGRELEPESVGRFRELLSQLDDLGLVEPTDR
jgi:PqqD family protein of HPr-rel-A system